MKTAVILVYLWASGWHGSNRQEFPMPDMETCLQAVKSARIVNTEKGASVAVFCAVKQ